MPLYETKHEGKVYIALYVDANLMIGNPGAIKEVVELLQKNGLVLSMIDELQDYLSYKIKFSQDKKTRSAIPVWEFEEKNGKKTPGMPKCLIIKPVDVSNKITIEDQKFFQSGMGMLLYPIKHSMPDIADAT